MVLVVYYIESVSSGAALVTRISAANFDVFLLHLISGLLCFAVNDNELI